MTKEEKERKIKLIALILIVQFEYARRKPFKDFIEAFCFYMENVFWLNELRIVQSQRVFEKGALAFTGTEKEEIIVRK